MMLHYPTLLSIFCSRIRKNSGSCDVPPKSCGSGYDQPRRFPSTKILNGVAHYRCLLPALLGLISVVSGAIAAASDSSARVVSFYGYEDCVRLENDQTRVTLCPAAGGRILEYAYRGENALYLPSGGEGWTVSSGKGNGAMTAGRFDIGPEQTIPRHPQLWMGPWTSKILGPRSARLTSKQDIATGVQLVREFSLDAETTRLTCKQTMTNASRETKEYCYWSRTFARGGGICVIPLSKPSRLPNHYVMYGPGPAINFRPEDGQILARDGFLMIKGPPQFPKLGMDTYAGWFSYLMPNNLMFVKRFPTYPDRVYNEVAGLTMSIWYPDGPMCELEPIGPRERLAPGDSASFTETWWLLPHAFPGDARQVDLEKVADDVMRRAN